APDYAEALLGYGRQLGLDVLIPGSDPELLPLAELRPELERLGCQVIVSAPECVRICRDKLALYQHMAPLGVPVVETWEFGAARQSAAELDYPLIVKPRGGSGSVGIRVVASPGDLAGLDLVGDWIVQPYLIPAEWGERAGEHIQALMASGRPLPQDDSSVQVMVDGDGQVVGRFASRNHLRAGVNMLVDPLDDPAMWAAGELLAQALLAVGLRGPCNLQGRITRAGVRFYEVNPRYTGATRARDLLGYREVEAGVRLIGLGEPAEDVRGLLAYDRDKVSLRQMTEIVVPRARVEEMATTGRTRRPPGAA
ncbi:MAG: hypothetical protein V1772_01425, partial [Chloroflexota bacterium]